LPRYLIEKLRKHFESKVCCADCHLTARRNGERLVAALSSRQNRYTSKEIEMTPTGKVTIRPWEDYVKSSDNDVNVRTTNAINGLTGNKDFANPPVDLVALKSDNDAFAALVAESADGSKRVIAQKNKQRHLILQKMRLLGRYVQVTANNDLALFNNSGIEPVVVTRTPQQPLSPFIRSISHGTSGQLNIRLKAVSQAASYELRYAVLTNNAPGTWTTVPAASVKTPITLSGLTPGADYAFEVRTLSASGYSDWSDSVTCICK
jgi:hypothetical protein